MQKSKKGKRRNIIIAVSLGIVAIVGAMAAGGAFSDQDTQEVQYQFPERRTIKPSLLTDVFNPYSR